MADRPVRGKRIAMATNREFTFEDYWAILRRRRWLLVLPVAAGVIGGFLLSLVLPEKYTSHTIVLVERPVVGDTYVKPVMTEDLNQRLASMKEQILSRTQLQHLVEKFGLYKKDAGTLPMEALVERLQQSIAVTPLSPMQGTQSAGLPGFNCDVTFGEARGALQYCSVINLRIIMTNFHLHVQQA